METTTNCRLFRFTVRMSEPSHGPHSRFYGELDFLRLNAISKFVRRRTY